LSGIFTSVAIYEIDFISLIWFFRVNRRMLSWLFAGTSPGFDSHRLITISGILYHKNLRSLFIWLELGANPIRVFIDCSLDLFINFNILLFDRVYEEFSVRVYAVLKVTKFLKETPS
jgi:hypothetical protein